MACADRFTDDDRPCFAFNDPAGAEGLIHGWIYGLTGNVLLFQIGAFVWSILLMRR